MKIFKLGLIINPIAGIGGSVALKGSDGEQTQQQAFALGANKLANQKTQIALEYLTGFKNKIEVYTANDEMGAALAQGLGFTTHIVHTSPAQTSAEDTKICVQNLINAEVDLILFAGGDGTARNICEVAPEHIPVLGIPAGCKIHSGVYTITPKAAGELCQKLISGEMLTLAEADVMDIDENQFRQGIVKAKRYGDLLIPMDLRYVQAVKQGGKETEELVLQDIAADIIELMEEDENCLYLIGSGSTTQAIMQALYLDNTLLGVDAVYQQNLVGRDLTENQIWQLMQQYPKTKLIISLIGGQGHILGRGNQQISPRIIAQIGKYNIHLVATKSKLQKLDGKPLIVDTLDNSINESLAGLIKVTTGFHDSVLYPVG
ncbi:ATP-NAD kinase family protein [Catenovulum sp. 2E275]|uniref:ATP-NAD kinase family protein n=1 Tax=Catenovulum sp. 2E275 TaxID=2980497 RepID=UPI0021D00DEF|nr:ATP-NAD kinase family protein [Catenovulum sp. 2E275]MCU4675773.1 ATP-NAD kinase family protein [Catenovulum sp. 2E275]